jgi:hypothetical protein
MPPGRFSNHRRPSVRAAARTGGSAALAALLSLAALGSLGATPAKSPDRKAPPFAPGFPIPIPRPVDYRPRWGSTLAVDLDRDGRAELLASVPSGDLFLIDQGGARVAGWPPSLADLARPAWPVGRPGFGDLDGDGREEVVACVNTGLPPRRAVLVAWHRDGRRAEGWPRAMATAGSCSPGGTLVADLDRDGRAEVAQAISPAEVWLFDGAGRAMPGFPFRPPLRANGVVPAINARLAAADLDGDGRLEIVAVESGRGPLLHGIALSGAEARSWPRLLPEVVDTQAPAAGDLDGDAMAEVVQSTLPVSPDFLRPSPGADSARFSMWVVPADPDAPAGPETPPPPPGPPAPVTADPGVLHTLHSDGGEAAGWPVPVPSGAVSGAMLIDLDGDGRSEVLQGDGDAIQGFDAKGQALEGFPLVLRHADTGAASRIDSGWVAGDLDGDGAIDFLRALGRMDPDATTLRIAAIRQRGSAPVPGTPWSVDGLLPASDPVLLDLTGDGHPEVAILAVEGTTGTWRLIAWDVAAGRSAGRAGVRTDALRGTGITVRVRPG